VTRALLVTALLALTALLGCGTSTSAPPPVVHDGPLPLLCGAQTCDARISYCEVIHTDVAALPSTYTCRPLPSVCLPDPEETAACGCFPAGTRCRNFCHQLDTAGAPGFELVCIGGA
jgi:hypothetical protein